jgi:S1-C subfamily serine protease
MIRRFPSGDDYCLRVVMSLVAAVCVPCAAGGDDSLESLYSRVQPAAVEILVEGHLAGSGCLVDKDGLVLTAAHVRGKPDRACEVNVSALGRLRAAFVAVDLGHDLVLLRLPPRAEKKVPGTVDRPSLASETLKQGTPCSRPAPVPTGLAWPSLRTSRAGAAS